MTDVFPARLSSEVKVVTYPRNNFKYVSNLDGVYPFVLQMQSNGKIYYHKMPFQDKIVEHFAFVYKESKRCVEFRPNDINWSQVSTRFKRPVLSTHRSNVDVRAGYKIGNAYLVKAFFTFGQRTVEEGTAHVYQMLEVPLLFYLWTEGTHKRPSREERVFPIHDLYLYERYVLEANKNYRIPAGTTYIVFSTQKIFFGMDKVAEDCVLPFPTEDPLVSRVRRIAQPYDCPPATPYIEHEDEREVASAVRSIVADPVAAAFQSTFQEGWDWARPSSSSIVYVPYVPVQEELEQQEPVQEVPVPEVPVQEEPVQEEPMQEVPVQEEVSPYLFEKNIVVNCPDFVENYKRVHVREYDQPPKRLRTNDSEHVEPLNLCTRDNFSELDQIIDVEPCRVALEDAIAQLC